jgi:hypothetical protein
VTIGIGKGRKCSVTVEEGEITNAQIVHQGTDSGSVSFESSCLNHLGR